MNNPLENERLSWFKSENIRPYVFVREDMRVQNPGSNFALDWFGREPVWLNPLHIDEVTYANQILKMESLAFGDKGLAMPRWVFYDCAIMPGFVAGFAQKTDSLSEAAVKALGGRPERMWTPISLFIIIPTMRDGEWFAHNLSSVNSLMPENKRLYGLGFLTKCFGLWYANIETCCGATQWASPARKLHAQYGAFEVMTSYTPVHDYPETLTYRLKVDPEYWLGFFTKETTGDFANKYEPAGFEVLPSSKDSLISLQRKIEAHEGPFFLSSSEIRKKSLDDPLSVFRPISK